MTFVDPAEMPEPTPSRVAIDHPIMERQSRAEQLTRDYVDALDDQSEKNAALKRARREAKAKAEKMSAAALKLHIEDVTTEEEIAYDTAEFTAKSKKALLETEIQGVGAAQSYFRLVERQT